jgi:hypothetical protein
MITVLHGMSGTGKSQIAKRYAEPHQSDYSVSFWINAAFDEAKPFGDPDFSCRLASLGSC